MIRTEKGFPAVVFWFGFKGKRIKRRYVIQFFPITKLFRVLSFYVNHVFHARNLLHAWPDGHGNPGKRESFPVSLLPVSLRKVRRMIIRHRFEFTLRYFVALGLRLSLCQWFF